MQKIEIPSVELSIEFKLPMITRIIMRLMLIARACGFTRPTPALGDWCLARGAYWRSGRGRWFRTSLVRE